MRKMGFASVFLFISIIEIDKDRFDIFAGYLMVCSQMVSMSENITTE